MKIVEKKRNKPIWSTPAKVALGCAIISTLASVTFGVLSQHYLKKTFGVVSGLLAGTSAAVFGVSFEPLWSVWKKKEMEKRDKDEPMPTLLNFEKIALAIMIVSALSATAFTVVAFKYKSGIATALAGASGALFGISPDPLWKAWARNKETSAGKEKAQAQVAKAALGVAITSTVMWILFGLLAEKYIKGFPGGSVALLAATASGIFGVSFEPLWGAWRKKEMKERDKNKPMPKLLNSEKTALGIMIATATGAIIFSLIAAKTKSGLAAAAAGISGAIFGIAPEPLWKAWSRHEQEEKKKKAEEERAAKEPPVVLYSLLLRDVID